MYRRCGEEYYIEEKYYESPLDGSWPSFALVMPIAYAVISNVDDCALLVFSGGRTLGLSNPWAHLCPLGHRVFSQWKIPEKSIRQIPGIFHIQIRKNHPHIPIQLKETRRQLNSALNWLFISVTVDTVTGLYSLIQSQGDTPLIEPTSDKS